MLYYSLAPVSRQESHLRILVEMDHMATTTHLKHTKPQAFLALAQNDMRTWQFAVGGCLYHTEYGLGIVAAVEHRGGRLEIDITFEDYDSPVSFHSELLFQSGKVSQFVAPIDMAQLQQKVKTAKELGVTLSQLETLPLDALEDINQFVKLKRKYHLGFHPDIDPLSPLYTVLLKFESKTPLELQEFNWLKEREIFAAMAVHQEQCFERSQDIWRIVYASRCWRDAQRPENAVAITEGRTTPDPKARAALLTTRGAALADTGNLSEAEKCAHRALEVDPTSTYAYALLARIYSELGYPEEAEEYGRKAQFPKEERA